MEDYSFLIIGALIIIVPTVGFFLLVFLMALAEDVPCYLYERFVKKLPYEQRSVKWG
jgi:hypothetical protein